MKINITDIPKEGRDLEFELDQAHINTRAEADRLRHNPSEEILPPEYHFERSPRARLNLQLEGRTVVVRGRTEAVYLTTCARCAEPARQELDIPVEIILKPYPQREEDRVEDVQLGFYDGKEVDCDVVVEEALVLSLPYAVFCRSDCRGLCQQCGANLNTAPCACKPDEPGDDRFAVLRGLKVQ